MIIDTNALSDLFRGDARLIKILLTEPSHHLPVVVLGEYRFGLKQSAFAKTLLPRLDRLEQQWVLLNLDSLTARFYADTRDKLRKSGRPMPENDMWIAALALQHRLPIVSRDAHFDAIEGLARIDWQSA